jgi:hypothetical protein
LKVKVFMDDKTDRLEAKVNQWLEQNFWVKIEQITQTTGEATCISIWYKEPDVPILG